MNLQQGPPHMDTALLILHLSGELDAPDAAAARAHLDACAACRERAYTLRTALAGVGRALVAADVAMPSDDEWSRMRARIAAAAPASRRRISDGAAALRAAAVILLLGAAVLALSPPLRAWAAERLRDLVGAPATPPAPVNTGTDAADAVASDVGFEADARVDVVFQSAQEAGTLDVRFTDDTAMARIGTVDGVRVPLVIGRGTVGVSNDASSRTSWTLDVPRSVQRVTLRIGTHEPVTFTRGAPTTPIDLAAGGVHR